MTWLIFRSTHHLTESVAMCAVAPFAINDHRALKKLAHAVVDDDSIVPDRPGQDVVSLDVACELVKSARAKRLRQAKQHPTPSQRAARGGTRG